MAFPNSKPSMPPPGEPKPDVVIGVGASPKKPGENGPEESEFPEKGQHKLAGAGVIREDEHCQQCENWEPETGNCKELPGTFSAGDACLAYFEPMSDSSDPNETDESEGEMPPPEPVTAGVPA